MKRCSSLLLLFALPAALASFTAYGMGPGGGGPMGSTGVGSGPGARGPSGPGGGAGPGGSYQSGPGPSGGRENGPGQGASRGPGPAGSSGAGAAGTNAGGRFTFNDLDRNRDGYISRSEARGDPTLFQNFSRYDRQHTGDLTRSEFRQFERDRDRLNQGAPGAGGGTPSGRGAP